MMNDERGKMKEFFYLLGLILLCFLYGWWKYEATRTALQEKNNIIDPSPSTVLLEMGKERKHG